VRIQDGPSEPIPDPRSTPSGPYVASPGKSKDAGEFLSQKFAKTLSQNSSIRAPNARDWTSAQIQAYTDHHLAEEKRRIGSGTLPLPAYLETAGRVLNARLSDRSRARTAAIVGEGGVPGRPQTVNVKADEIPEPEEITIESFYSAFAWLISDAEALGPSTCPDEIEAKRHKVLTFLARWCDTMRQTDFTLDRKEEQTNTGPSTAAIVRRLTGPEP